MVALTYNDPLVNAFERTVRDLPDSILFASPRSRTTAREVDALALALGARIDPVAFPPGSIAGVRAANGPAFLAALLACRRAGVVALLLDARAPDDVVRRVLDRLGAVGWIRSPRAWPDGDREIEVTAAPLREPVLLPLEQSAVIMLTSGSTGEPRGIVTSSAALLADAAALTASMGIRPEDRLLATVPFSHSYGLSSLVVPALARGAPLIVPNGNGPFHPLEAARHGEATIFPTVPAYLAGLLRVKAPPSLPPTIRLILTAGAPLLPETARRFRECYGQAVHVLYGASECGGITYDRTGTAAERGTVGTPVEGVRVTLEDVGGDWAGGAGRVTVSSPAVAERYLPENDPRLEGGRFAADDLGAWFDDELALVGRLGNLINVRGKKVNPVEVEQVLVEMPGVDDAKVLGMPRRESGDEWVRAVVACAPGSVSIEQILAWCRSRLNDYKVPRGVVLVERLPVDGRGKLDRKRLAAIAATGLSVERSSG